jgi:hypothetical protein
MNSSTNPALDQGLAWLKDDNRRPMSDPDTIRALREHMRTVEANAFGRAPELMAKIKQLALDAALAQHWGLDPSAAFPEGDG